MAGLEFHKKFLPLNSILYYNFIDVAMRENWEAFHQM